MSKNIINIKKIIEEEDITTFYQPIISLKRGKIIGFEALCRHYDKKDNLLSYVSLYKEAKKEKLLIEFDRLCRKKSIENFKIFYNLNDEWLLFLNFDTSLLNYGVLGSKVILNTVKEFNIPPDKIVIELIENKVFDNETLKNFVALYKNEKFMFAIDDFGENFSNIERITIIKPDVIKIAKSFCKHNKIYHDSILNATSKFINKLGILPLLEGVETEEDLNQAFSANIDLFQGFFFSHPVKNFDDFTYQLVMQKINYASKINLNFNINKVTNEKKRKKEYLSIVKEFKSKIANFSVRNFTDNSFENFIFSLLKEYSAIECLYFINWNGVQMTKTFLNYNSKINNPIFKPAIKNDYHYLKDYFLAIKYGSKLYFSEPYISLATGNLIITISTIFKDRNNKKVILCFDFLN